MRARLACFHQSASAATFRVVAGLVRRDVRTEADKTLRRRCIVPESGILGVVIFSSSLITAEAKIFA
jgi:hypothetical protein